MNAGTFLALPLLAVLLTRQLHASAGVVGTAFSAFLVAARGLPLLTGSLADRAPPQMMMMSGCLLRAGGFGLLAVADHPRLAIAAAAVAGAGAAVYEPAMSAALARGAEATRTQVFALRTTALNLGAIAGPALGGLLLHVGLRTPFAAAAALFAILGLLMLTTATDTAPVARQPVTGVRPPWRDPPFTGFLTCLIVWYVLFAQLTVGFPLRAAAVGTSATITAIFLVNAVLGLASVPLANHLLHRHGAARGLRAGLLLAAAGFTITGTSPTVFAVIAGMAVYSIGETLVLIARDTTIASYARHGRPAAYFGLASLPWLLGGWAATTSAPPTSATPIATSPGSPSAPPQPPSPSSSRA